MTRPELLFVDVSSNDPPHNLDAHWKAGYRVLALKVTEGTSYLWPASHDLAAKWHVLGGVVIHYHFLHPGNAASGQTQADYFWEHVRHDVKPGDVLVEDVETSGENGAEHAAFQARLKTHTKLARWTYGSAYFLRVNGIKPHGTRLWIAGYPTYPFIPPGWNESTLAAHQFTDAARKVAGMPASVDQSVLLAPLWKAPVRHQPTPKPKPAPKPPKHAPRWFRSWWSRWLKWSHGTG